MTDVPPDPVPAPTPISMEELATITTWEEVQDFSNRGIDEVRAINAQLPDLTEAMRQSRDALQAAQDRKSELQSIMAALIAKAPEYK